MDRMERLACKLKQREEERAAVWDSLWARKSIGRIAVAVPPDRESLAVSKETWRDIDLEPVERSSCWTPKWADRLQEGLVSLDGALEMPGDGCPGLAIPRFVHGQSQGICDLFGRHVELQPDGNYFVHPMPPDPEVVRNVEPRPLDSSLYRGAVEWLRYARDVTRGLLPFRNPVMTGLFDTCNYLLGTTTLLEWVHTEQDVLHGLLAKVTEVLSRMVGALKEAAGGSLLSHHLGCMRGGWDLCSECRSLVSKEVYEEFEAPYLRKLGQEQGPYAVHSCGSWERTVPSALEDPNLRAMNGQVRENDLAQLCRLSAGRIALSINPTSDVLPRYAWKDMRENHLFLLRTVPRDQPLEVSVAREDVPLWNRLCRECGVEYNQVVLRSIP